ncbi:MAG: hypothetical protein ACPIOQ_80235, partial [Promethearchaeia archaeon]
PGEVLKSWSDCLRPGSCGRVHWRGRGGLRLRLRSVCGARAQTMWILRTECPTGVTTYSLVAGE